MSTTGELQERKSKKVAALIKKIDNTAVGIRRADHTTLSICKSESNFTDKWRSLGRYSLLAD
jgi:hypothetical protein